MIQISSMNPSQCAGIATIACTIFLCLKLAYDMKNMTSRRWRRWMLPLVSVSVIYQILGLVYLFISSDQWITETNKYLLFVQSFQIGIIVCEISRAFEPVSKFLARWQGSLGMGVLAILFVMFGICISIYKLAGLDDPFWVINLSSNTSCYQRETSPFHL